MNVQDLAASLVGPLVPWLVQLIRVRLLPGVSPKVAQALALGVSLAGVGVAYYTLDKTPTAAEFLGNVGAAFTLAQMTYRQFEEAVKTVGAPVESE